MSAYDNAILADRAVSFWTLGEASGSSAGDSGDSNSGTYTGTFTLGQTGIGDGETAVGLDGSTGGVSFTAGTNLDFTTACSLEAWVNPTAATESALIVGRGTSNVQFDWRLGLKLGIAQFRSDIAGIGDLAAANTAVAVNQWNHVVVTYDGSNVHYYLNGSPDGTVPVTSATLQNDASTKGHIGADLFSTINFLAGSLAKVAVYGYVLTPAQVAAHFAVPLTAALPPRRMPQGV